MANDVGKLRRSTIVSTYGPGAVVDFRAGGAAISGVIAGLEEWDYGFGPAGLANPQRIQEPRLEKKLGVQGFRLPPVIDENNKKNNPDLNKRLVAVRFPDWLQYTKCERIGPTRKWNDDPGYAGRYCGSCTRKSPGSQKIFVVPVRFVMACEAGHLDDFPWHGWLGHKPDCKNKDMLRLHAERAGLSGLILSCEECKQSRSMDGIFSDATWERHKCHGKRPWLGTAEDNCTKTLRALQRGASNLYFPAIESALSIPPWSDSLQEALGIYWHSLVTAKPEDLVSFITMLANGELKPVLEELKMTPQGLAVAVKNRIALLNDQVLDIRAEEYRQFTLGSPQEQNSSNEFEIRPVTVPKHLQLFFSKIIRVVRLREVRALHGFTRIHPPGENSEIAPIWRKKPNWLPAIEVRGEGIFLEFNASHLVAWETDAIKERAHKLNELFKHEWKIKHGDTPVPFIITAKFLLLHTFSHVLMRQLTLECGYSSASLKERLYVSDDENPMSGILIYTSTSDADGTLGGLQRQGEASRIGNTIPAAVQAVEWCSSDPLCIEDIMSSVESMSLAACHACVFAPETACEHFNRFLDRALLVGTPSAPETGYFSTFLKRP